MNDAVTAEPERCVVCHLSLPDGYGGLCDEHKYDEQRPAACFHTEEPCNCSQDGCPECAPITPFVLVIEASGVLPAALETIVRVLPHDAGIRLVTAAIEGDAERIIAATRPDQVEAESA